MIGRLEIDHASEEAMRAANGGWVHGLAELGFKPSIVEEYGERAVAAFKAAGMDPEEAVKAGFRLGLQLGYRIHRTQSKARRP